MSETWEKTGDVGGALAELASLINARIVDVAFVREFFDKHPIIAVIGQVENVGGNTSVALAGESKPRLKVSDEFRGFVTALRADQSNTNLLCRPGHDDASDEVAL